MTISERIQFASLLVAVVALALTHVFGLLQRSQKDKRSNTKLRIFRILGDRSLEIEAIAEEYRRQHGKVAEAELSRALYEMLVDGTAYYEVTKTYRARWRNPKVKDPLAPDTSRA